jgi:hypothetical protein
MHDAQIQGFVDELNKAAGLRDAWRNLVDYFRPETRKQRAEAKKFVSSSDPDKWDGFLARVRNPQFVKQLQRTGADQKLVQHAKSMHSLTVGKVVGNIEGSSGKVYDVKRLPGGGVGCTCRDWRFRGSINPGYECKHVRAHKAGMKKVAGFGSMTESFFNELGNIQRSQRDAANEPWHGGGEEGDGERPFSNLLTQDEEPSLYNPRPAQAIEEPEVILGGNG